MFIGKTCATYFLIKLIKRCKHFNLQPLPLQEFIANQFIVACHNPNDLVYCCFFFFRNYNYGEASKDLKVDLLNHPDYINQNSTLAFQVAIWRWMVPIKKYQPSAHDVFIGHWKPTKNDTLAKRVPGFGTTMNVLYGDLVCGQDDNEFMNNIISHYLYYLDLMGVGQEEAGPHELLSCSQQVSFNPSSSFSLNG